MSADGRHTENWDQSGRAQRTEEIFWNCSVRPEVPIQLTPSNQYIARFGHIHTSIISSCVRLQWGASENMASLLQNTLLWNVIDFEKLDILLHGIKRSQRIVSFKYRVHRPLVEIYHTFREFCRKPVKSTFGFSKPVHSQNRLGKLQSAGIVLQVSQMSYHSYPHFPSQVLFEFFENPRRWCAFERKIVGKVVESTI